MIKAYFDYENNNIASFKLTGHADSGDYGKDIVCAAVSSLAISIVNALDQVAGIKPLIDQDEKQGGYLAVTIRDSDINNDIVQALLKTLKNGISSIAQQYSKYVEID